MQGAEGPALAPGAGPQGHGEWGGHAGTQGHRFVHELHVSESLSLSVSLMAQRLQLLALSASPDAATATWFVAHGLPPERAAAGAGRGVWDTTVAGREV